MKVKAIVKTIPPFFSNKKIVCVDYCYHPSQLRIQILEINISRDRRTKGWSNDEPKA